MTQEAGKKFYITTAIDYANGDPHFGHALEKIGAELTKSEAWIRDRRSFLVTTTERLFDWK